MIDLSRMNDVHLSHDSKTLSVGAGTPTGLLQARAMHAHGACDASHVIERRDSGPGGACACVPAGFAVCCTTRLAW